MEARTQIVDLELPDGSVVSAEVVVEDEITDIGVLGHFKLDETRDTVLALTRWVVDSVRGMAEDSAAGYEQNTPPGMRLTTVGAEFGLKLALKSGKITSVLAEAGAEASAVLKLEWSRTAHADTEARVS